VNLVGSPGSGKSHLAVGGIAWRLLHMRLATFYVLSNVGWERCVSVDEYDIDIEQPNGTVAKVHKRIPVTEECAPPHARIIPVQALDELLVEAAKIQKRADALHEDYRLCFVQDEAPVSQVGSGSKVVSSYTNTSAGLMALISLMRRYGGNGMCYVPISLSEELLMTKLRSEGDSAIPGLVTALFSKDPSTIREIASGTYRGRELSQRWVLDQPLIEYVAVIPNLYGWEPFIMRVPSVNPLACPPDRMVPGTVSYTTKGISGFGTGKLPDGRPFRPEALISALTGLHPSKVPDRVLEFLRGSESGGGDEVTDEQIAALGDSSESTEPTEELGASVEPTQAVPKPDKKKVNLVARVRKALVVFGPEASGVNEFEELAKTRWKTVLKLVEEGHIDESELPKWEGDDA